MVPRRRAPRLTAPDAARQTPQRTSPSQCDGRVARVGGRWAAWWQMGGERGRQSFKATGLRMRRRRWFSGGFAKQPRGPREMSSLIWVLSARVPLESQNCRSSTYELCFFIWIPMCYTPNSLGTHGAVYSSSLLLLHITILFLLPILTYKFVITGFLFPFLYLYLAISLMLDCFTLDSSSRCT